MNAVFLTSCLAVTAAFTAMAPGAEEAERLTDRPDRIKIGQDRPWQTDDGVIHHQGRTFGSWRAFHQARLADGNNGLRCGTAPIDVEAWGQVEGFLPPSDCSNSNTNPAAEYDPSNGIFRVPCVVHVIRNNDGSLGDIPESRVISGIRILNEDFKALAGTNGENGTDCQIEFYLAEVDPDGNPTNGITFSNNTTWYNDGGSYWNSLAWDPNRYMNIYTTTASGALGYVPFLPANGNVGGNEDRVVVLWESYGEGAPIGPPYNLGRTLTHEVGHYLGLFHTFNGGCGSGSCYNSGDTICDTSPQNNSTFGCTGSSCSGTPPDDNYMDYSDDQCMEKFTPEQARRMRCTLLNWRQELADQGPTYITLSPFGDPPALVAPIDATLRVRITENEEGGYRTGSGTLHYRQGGSFSTVTLADEGLGVFAGTIGSLECGEPIEWFFTAEDVEQTVKRLPAGTGVFTALVADESVNAFLDDAETDLGYTVTDSGTDGTWGIGVPIDCNRGDPDQDGDGSGRCWLTDNSSANACNSDVDGGATVLVTPEIELEGGDAYLSYYVWYDNTGAGQGASPGADVFISEITSDGVEWTLLETIGPSDDRSSGGWTYVTFRVADYITPSGPIQVRFTAEDAGDGSVIEAAVDGLRVDVLACSDGPPACPGDVNDDGIVDGTDLSILLGFWNLTEGPADLNDDGIVDGTDLSILLGFWGACPG